MQIHNATRTGLQAMIDVCSEFAGGKNLKFGTNVDPEKSKTKCVVFSKNKRDFKNLTPLKLLGCPLPWVEKLKHLGNTLQNDNSMCRDILLKRGKYIGKVNSLLQYFHYVNPGPS